MKNKGIDQFRVIAAMMVVAIHCLPLHYLWPEGDILITLTIFRVAVPFFFMISGYYVFAELAVANSYPSRQRVFNFIKKQLKVYLLATLMFLPLALRSTSWNISTSTFGQWHSLSSLVLSGFDYWEPAPNKFADTCLLQKSVLACGWIVPDWIRW